MGLKTDASKIEILWMNIFGKDLELALANVWSEIFWDDHRDKKFPCIGDCIFLYKSHIILGTIDWFNTNV